MRRLKLPVNDDVLRAELSNALRGSREALFLHRLHAILLVSSGCSCYEVANWFGENPRSVERWIHAYDREGVTGLHDRARSGRASLVTRLMQQQLMQDLHDVPCACGYAHPRWSGKLLARHLETRFGLNLGERQCQRLLHRLLKSTAHPT